MSYSRIVSPPPYSAVSNGRCNMGTYSGAIQNVNLRDAYRPLGFAAPRFIQNFRLKEWQAFQFVNDDWFMCVAVYNTKTVGTAIIMAFNRAQGQMYRYEHKAPFWKLKVANGLFGTRSYYRHKNLSIEIQNNLQGQIFELSFSTQNISGLPPLAGKLVAQAVTEPIVIVQPFAKNRPLYSHKALMRATGTISFKGQTTQVEEHQGCVIIDDHKGFYPTLMNYDWVTALGYSPEGILQGFNLTDNQIRDPNKYNENCLWHNGKMHPLPPVKISRPQGVNNTWLINDHYGLVDLRFTPLADVPVKIKIAGLSLVDYHGPTGLLTGYIIGVDGEQVLFDDFIGMGEQKAVRM
jgi:hypothetical protein